MARPTKAEKQKTEIVKKYFKRDSIIYTVFEENTKGINKERVLNLFVEQSIYRNTLRCHGGIRCSNDNFNKSDKIYFPKLYKIDKWKHDYYTSLVCYAENSDYGVSSNIQSRYLGSDINGKPITQGVVNSYLVGYSIDEIRLIEIFGEDRVKELGGNGYPHYLSHLNLKLTATEKEILRKSIDNKPNGTRTIIEKKVGHYGSWLDCSDVNSFLVEVNFTHPLEEIQEHIKFLYNEYNTKKILNIFDVLNLEREPEEYDELYQTNDHKPFNVLLADKLFMML